MSAIVEAELISSPMLVPRFDDLPPLTHKQSKFVNAYIETRNGTKAAQLAGFKGDDNTLGVCAYDLLRNHKIQAHLQHALKQRQISPDEVLAELSDIAIAPWKDFLEVKYGPNNEVIDARLRLSDKLKSLEVLARLLGMDKPQENSDSSSATRELVTMLQTLTARAKELQAQPATEPQLIPASVGEYTP